MKYSITALSILAASSGMAFAQGDAEAGAKVFNQCQTCHVVAAPDGTILAGKASKTGPNLYGIMGRPAASYEGFRYGPGITEAKDKGLVWDEAQLVSYVQDPGAFLKEFTGDSKARTLMVFKLRKEEDASNVVAFLASLQPAEEPAATN